MGWRTDESYAEYLTRITITELEETGRVKGVRDDIVEQVIKGYNCPVGQCLERITYTWCRQYDIRGKELPVEHYHDLNTAPNSTFIVVD